MPNTAIDTAIDTALVGQLRTLHQLAGAEAAAARAHAAQAGTETVRRELAVSARAATERGRAVARVLRDLGAAPGPFAPALGWVSTMVRAAVEQTQAPEEALIADLTLHHQIAERARYLLAQSENGPAPVRELAERLVLDHEEAIVGLRAVLAGAALGVTAPLRPTPWQAMATGLTRLATLPVRLTADSVGRAVRQVSRGRTADRDPGTDGPARGTTAAPAAGPGLAAAADLADAGLTDTAESLAVSAEAAAAGVAAAEGPSDADLAAIAAGTDLPGTDVPEPAGAGPVASGAVTDTDVVVVTTDPEVADTAADEELAVAVGDAADVEIAEVAADDEDLSEDLGTLGVGQPGGRAVDDLGDDLGAPAGVDAAVEQGSAVKEGAVETTISDPAPGTDAMVAMTDPAADTESLLPTGEHGPADREGRGPTPDSAATGDEDGDGDEDAGPRRLRGSTDGDAPGLPADELPIADYDSLVVRDVTEALEELEDVAELTAVEEYERQHKNRVGVLTAVQARAAALTHDSSTG